MLHLTTPSDEAWVRHALGDLDALLVDHAHCEMKAASNALSIAARNPADPMLVSALTDLAKEEIDHFQRVHRVLQARGTPLTTPAADPYVVALRRALASLGPAKLGPSSRLVDELLVCALIEARSCERFDVLARALAADDPSLASFYAELFASEARHYTTFVELAQRVSHVPDARVWSRLDALAGLEGVVVGRAALSAARSTMHG